MPGPDEEDSVSSAIHRTLASLVLLLVASGPAAALDQPIAANQLKLTRSPSGRERLVFLSTDPAFLFPAVGSADDPAAGTPGGMLIELFSTAEPTGAALAVPPGPGKPGWRVVAASTPQYTFVNPSAPAGISPVKHVLAKRTRRLKITAPETGLALAGPQGAVGIRITMGSLVSCARFAGAAIRRDRANQFVGLQATALGLADCSDESLGGLPPPTTTTTTLPTTTTTTTATTTTTTTTTSTETPTTTPTSGTTTTLLPPLLPLTVEFAGGQGSGACGATRDGDGHQLEALGCGALSLGGGNGILLPATLPDGAVNHFSLDTSDLGCVVSLLTSCPLGPTTLTTPDFDCTDTGCAFGAPVPIPNGGLSACSIGTFAGPASGTVNLLTGETSATVPLSLQVFLTGNAVQPCPRCSASGAPGAVGSGTCDRGARAGLPCTTRNSAGGSSDCPPGPEAIELGTLTATLPVTTGTAAGSDPDGIFCPGQPNGGCFGDPACREITATGSAPNALLAALTPQPATLVSLFCIPATGSPLVDGPADLPGPAAISLAGTIRASF